MGVWIAVLDNNGRVLLLKRGAELRTCPGTWGLVGEHLLNLEKPEALVRRALDEELGAQLWASVVHSINLTATPVWYRRDYDAGRIDRQATWLWAIVLQVSAQEALLQPDQEVMD